MDEDRENNGDNDDSADNYGIDEDEDFMTNHHSIESALTKERHQQNNNSGIDHSTRAQTQPNSMYIIIPEYMRTNPE